MAGHNPPRVFTIAVHHAFADALAAGLLKQHQRSDDPLALARGMLLLPNARAVRAVRDAFIRHAGEALLLPRLVAIGEDDLEAAAGSALDRIEGEPLPPAIDPLQRRLLLAHIIRVAHPEQANSPAAAVKLADGLARLLDALAIEEVAFDELSDLLTEDAAIARHWGLALDLLTHVSEHWPTLLATLGVSDRAVRRNQLFDRTTALWGRDGLPTGWLCAAGITVSAPAIARLLRTIACADGGSVVFPYLDQLMEDSEWAMLGGDPRDREEGTPRPRETHPQYHLKLLLERMGIARAEVEAWPVEATESDLTSRPAVFRHLFAPAEATRVWPTLSEAERKLPGVCALDCADPAEEALTIALAMREMLNQPGKTAALVTPDRGIATRVAAQFARWGIKVDDSAGEPLAQTPAGRLLLSLAAAAASHFAPVPLLTLLAHPLVGTGGAVDEGELSNPARLLWLDGVRALDLALRGPRPPAGLGGIIDALAGEKQAETLEWWSTAVLPLLQPLTVLEDRTLEAALPVLRAGLEALAGEGIWAGADGRALAALFDELTLHAAAWPEPVAVEDLAPLLATLMEGVSVRQPQGGHPRLFIWGLIEARLQRADRMILAGLNEGQWPQLPTPDPWLAPGLRRRLGLPGADRQIGLSSHDFSTALGAPDVLLTRALREGTAPTVPSRLRLRIDALLGEKLKPKSGPLDLSAVARVLDARAVATPVAQPQPAPPVDLRPKAISASALDTLLADPYSWYAAQILGLRPLDPLDAVPDARWQGIYVHELLHQWLKGESWDPDLLVTMARNRLLQKDISALLRTMWGPRLYDALKWVGETIVEQRREGRHPILAATECRGEMTVHGITLSGKADRIDRLLDGSLAVIDYKTGGSPKPSQVNAGFGNQLGLLGALAQAGAFDGTGAAVSTFEYWRLNRRPKGGGFGHVTTPFLQRGDIAITADNCVEAALGRLAEGAAYLTEPRPFTAKQVPAYAPYADYDQLMRLEEWYGALRDEGETA